MGSLFFESQGWTSKGRYPESYETSFGKAEVKRHVYQTFRGGKTFCPLERRAGILEGATPRFAKVVASKYARFGAAGVQQDLKENHGRAVSISYIQKVCDTVGLLVMSKGQDWHYGLPATVNPTEVTTVSIGLDGTCLLAVEGGYKQAMAGTITLLDGDGERLHTIYVGSAPQSGKATFLHMLRKEVEAVTAAFPKATIVGLADGARDNWEFLNTVTDRQIIDFFHVAEYLGDVAEVVFPDVTERKEWLDRRCHDLKHRAKAAQNLVIELKELITTKRKKSGLEVIQKTLTYLDNNKHMMDYPAALNDNLPIGSGVTEAACKVLVKQRLGCAGMRWTSRAAHVVLQLRALSLTPGRWQSFWNKVAIYGTDLPKAA